MSDDQVIRGVFFALAALFGSSMFALAHWPASSATAGPVLCLIIVSTYAGWLRGSQPMSRSILPWGIRVRAKI